MRMYDIALFFAIVGAMSGITNYIMVDAGGDNWFDQSVPDMQVIDLTQDDIESLQADGGSGILQTIENTAKYFNIISRVFQGVFLIISILDDVLVYDVDGSNLFLPVLVFFQIIIYAVYIVGAAQFIMNRSMKGME